MANTYLEGTWSEIYPDMPQNEEGMATLFRKFSWPGGLSSHVSPQVPGSLHEGGELGYSLSHAFGAVFDNPTLIATCVVGDGEAETGPLATAWHSNKFLNPKTDGAVLPILHLNGYKISNPTVLSRIEHEELEGRQVQGTALHEVDDPSRGADHDAAAALEGLDLRGIGGAAIDGHSVDSAEAGRVGSESPADLDSQLTGGGQDQRPNLLSAVLDLVEQGQPECRGLT